MTSATLLAMTFAACSGGGASIGAGASGPSGGSNSTPAPGTGATPTSAPTAPPVTTQGVPTSPPTAPATASAAVPPTPAPGQCRAGNIYNEFILTNDAPKDTEAFTVFEPAQLCGGQTYPLVMWGPGYSASRQTTPSPAPVAGNLSPGNIASLIDAGYGVVSIDERGFGDDTGTVRVMDPNFEGYMDLSVMDWAQANLSWIAYGPTLEGDDPHEPIMGSVGGSYGGMYQKMLLNLDKRHRLHAIVPQISPNDLNYSLFPNAVIKSAWDLDLYVLGQSGGSNLNRAREDQFLQTSVTNSILANDESQPVHDFFGYHSSSYFCNGASIASDGDAGSVPLWTPARPPKINALLFQGIRDTLFTLNNAWGDYQCWSQNGGDVRMLSYLAGHNELQVVPDPYISAYYNPQGFLNTSCGSTNVDTATVAFFDQYLKGKAGAANAIPSLPCFAIDVGDAVLTPTFISGHAGTKYAVPSTAVVAGSGLDVPTAIALGPAFATSAVIAGFPRIEVNVAPVAATGEPILFFGIGQMHASKPGAWDLLDNQLTPIRGAGEHDLDMTGIAARVAPGDQVALLVFGLEDQYDATGSANVAQPAVVPVTVSGSVWVPFASNAVTAP